MLTANSTASTSPQRSFSPGALAQPHVTCDCGRRKMAWPTREVTGGLLHAIAEGRATKPGQARGIERFEGAAARRARDVVAAAAAVVVVVDDATTRKACRASRGHVLRQRGHARQSTRERQLNSPGSSSGSRRRPSGSGAFAMMPLALPGKSAYLVATRILGM